ncbi:hypothetical protein BDZ89DRAFT_1071079 [Hymenopellis radicata]|nr:hypothetical protein BDZ89DRAFT_1071079 [Hymenopellis radicata]
MELDVEQNLPKFPQYYPISAQQASLLPLLQPTLQEESMVQEWRQLGLRTAQLRDELALLEGHQKDLRDLQSQFDATTSLVRSIPPEVLQEIFSAYLQLAPETSVFDITKGPWVLCRVCRKWSAVMHSSSALWTVSIIGIGVWTAHKLRDPVALLKCFLERTGSTRDIRFSTTGTVVVPQLRDGLTEELLSILISISPRWRDVKFCRFKVTSLAPLSAIRGRLPRLRSLVFLARVLDTQLPTPVTFFDTAQELEELKFAGLELVDFQLPGYSQLRTVVDLSCRNIRDSTLHSVHILRDCPNLRSLKTYPGHWGDSSWQITERVTHSTLTSLTTSDVDLLSALILPNIVKLEIIPPQRSNKELAFVEAVFRIVSLLRISKCGLQILMLTDCQFRGDDLVMLLPLLPDLIELHVGYTLPLEQCLTQPDLAMGELISMLRATTDDANSEDEDSESSDSDGDSGGDSESSHSDAEDSELSDQDSNSEDGPKTPAQFIETAPGDDASEIPIYTMLPRLSVFCYSDLGSSKPLYFVDAHFLNLLKLRQRYGAGFKRVRIEYNSRTSPAVLRELKRAGLDISIFKKPHLKEPAFNLV